MNNCDKIVPSSYQIKAKRCLQRDGNYVRKIKVWNDHAHYAPFKRRRRAKFVWTETSAKKNMHKMANPTIRNINFIFIMQQKNYI